jgi:hypothetical protein
LGFQENKNPSKLPAGIKNEKPRLICRGFSNYNPMNIFKTVSSFEEKVVLNSKRYENEKVQNILRKDSNFSRFFFQYSGSWQSIAKLPELSEIV